MSTGRDRPRFECWGRLWPAAERFRDVVDGGAWNVPGQSGSVLPFGNGRSYGDACLNSDGTLLSTHGLDRILDFDGETGVITAESGVLLYDLIRFALPRGWFLPVTPGTQFVTLGGAIANDVHGKNHHAAGTFGRHVLDLELVRSDGSTLQCSPTQNSEHFHCTIGGLGLTGLITSCRLRLLRVPGPRFSVTSIRFGDLGEFVALSESLDPTHDYTVSWVDCLGGRGRSGRGWYMAGNHAPPEEQVEYEDRPVHLSVPLTPPFSPMNRVTLRLFNTLYFYRPVPQGQVVDFRPFFYPLDAVHRWNRLYGRRGFYQFQNVVPPEVAQDALQAVLDEVRRSGQGSFLAVLKRFGDATSPGVLSFPRPGLTLALDFPNRGDATRALLRRLEDITMEAGGALYPAKDALMRPGTFRRSYPEWERLARTRDPVMTSDLWERVARD